MPKRGTAKRPTTSGPTTTSRPTATADPPEPGNVWYTKRPPDADGSRDGHGYFRSWLQLQPYGERFVRAYVTTPLLRCEYYSIARSWRESAKADFSEKWCTLLEGVLDIATGTLQRDDFASMHKFLFWQLATALYQQIGKQAIGELFPPHDDARVHDFVMHGVPNGNGGGGLPAGGLNVPP